MNKLLNITNRKFLTFTMCICLIIFTGAIIFYSGMNYKFNNFIDKNYIQLSQDWTLIDNDTLEIDTINLPEMFSYNLGKSYTFSKTLDFDTLSGKDKLFIQSGFSNLEVYINGKEIYNFFDNDFDKYSNKAKCKMHLISIPNNIKNSKLEIKAFIHDNSSLSYNLASVMIGSSISIFYKLIVDQLFSLLIIFVTAIISILVFTSFIISLFMKSKTSYILFFIGLFSMFSSLYAFSESNIIQLIIPNLYIINTITFMTLLLLPIPLLAIMLEYTKDKYKYLLSIALYILLLNFFIQTILNFLEIRDYRSMLSISHTIIVCTIILVLFVYFNSYKKNTLSERYFFISTLPLILGVTIDLLLYYFKRTLFNGIFFQGSILIFIIFHLWSVFQSYVNYSTVSLQSQLYKELALKDALTNLNNRYSFENKIQELNNSLNLYNSIWCISIDINNLKYINDHLGHNYGDKLIISFAKILKTCFEGVGLCYRIGGDEFVVIVCNLLKPEIIDLLDLLRYKVEKFNTENNSFYLSFAVGYDNYRVVKDSNLSDVLIRSDKLMYKNKSSIKSLRKADAL